MQTTQNDNPNALPIKKVGPYLGGLSTSRVYEILKSGKIKTFKIGKRRMVLRSELDRYIEEHTEVGIR